MSGTQFRTCHAIDRLGDAGGNVQIGYMRVSKADGSQSTDLQRDALGTAGVAGSTRTAPLVGSTRGRDSMPH